MIAPWMITRTMLLLLILQLCFVKLVSPSPRSQDQLIPKDQSSNQEARKLWEQAIAAKGGREKLHSVRNVLMSTRAEYTTHLGKRNSIVREELFVLPDKTWTWNDMRPDVFGLRIEMYNYEARIAYVLGPDAPNDEIRQLSHQYTWEEFGLLNSQVVSLMETKWVKPKPVAFHQEKIRGKLVNIVQTQVFGKRIDFALDPTTHLPSRITFYEKLITGGEGFTISVVDLLEYIEIDGIKIAQKLTSENNPVYGQTIQINVDYNKDIFMRPTTIEAGREAWRPKTKE